MFAVSCVSEAANAHGTGGATMAIRDVFPNGIAAPKRRDAVILVNVIVFYLAVHWPTKEYSESFNSIYKAYTEPSSTILNPLIWLFAANVISILSVAALNLKTGLMSGQFSKSDKWKNIDRERRRVFAFLFAMVVLSLLLLLPLGWYLIEAALVFASVWFTNPVPVPKNYDNFVYGFLIVTGPTYLISMLLNDVLACLCISAVSRLRRHPEYSSCSKDAKESASALFDALRTYPWIIVFVDLPILFGIGFVFWEKSKLGGGVYAIGFATGALAMHVIAANLISVIMDYVLRNRLLRYA
jgi:hypothetical protein